MGMRRILEKKDNWKGKFGGGNWTRRKIGKEEMLKERRR